MHPPDNVLQTFAVRVVAPLGGRINQHWLVSSGGEQLVLRRWCKPGGDIDYEMRLLARIAALGWPVAPVVAAPVELSGAVWCLFPLLPGDPPSLDDPVVEQRARGRLLAEFHADLANCGALGQRFGWRRCEEILADPALDHVLAAHENERSEEVRLLRWHLARSRNRVSDLRPHLRSSIIVHGDFTPWNLRYSAGRLTGILDFELAHLDHRVGDFALSWRGKYDELVRAYAEVSPLEPEEWELLTPVWWASLIEGACQHLAAGTWDDGWTIKSLLRRSPLMGPDSADYK